MQHGRTPLYWASEYGKTEAVVELLKANATVDLKDEVMSRIRAERGYRSIRAGRE